MHYVLLELKVLVRRPLQELYTNKLLEMMMEIQKMQLEMQQQQRELQLEQQHWFEGQQVRQEKWQVHEMIKHY